MVLNSNPIQNEPGYDKEIGPRADKYKRLLNYNNQKNLKEINSKIKNKFFINNNYINLQNKEEYLSMFFPLLYNKIKSYILLKININKKYYLIISIGSKNKEKFSIKQGAELITFFVKVCENKIQNLINQKAYSTLHLRLSCGILIFGFLIDK